MRVLLVKTSSLGDLIHSLPALTDAAAAIPGIRFHWVAEEAFAEIPAWHPAVERVIPIALRRWRRGWGAAWRSGEIGAFVGNLRRHPYDLIIDAQGLFFKSAMVAALARGPRAGYDRASARDPWVAWTYQRRWAVSRERHAIERVRRLFALALDYALPDTPPDYGLDPGEATTATPQRPYLVFLHGTTWPSKHWPEAYWAELAALAGERGFEIRLPWGNDEERQRAGRLAADCPAARLLPRTGLPDLARELRGAAGVVGLDSGLSHLAAALGTPGVTLYGPTRAELTGVIGPRHRNLVAKFPCAPCLDRVCGFSGTAGVSPACYQTLPPVTVWEALAARLQPEAA